MTDDNLTPTEQHYALLNAKDGVLLGLLAAVYARIDTSDAVFEQVRREALNQDWGDGPIADATIAMAERELQWFKERVARLRSSGG